MGKREHELLGIAAQEPQRHVDNAYRDLQRHFRSRTRRYRETTRAYENVTRGASGEARRAAGGRVVALARDFQTGDPPLEEVVHAIRGDFTGSGRKSGGAKHLGLIIEAAEPVDVAVPVFHPCPRCHGTGTLVGVSCRGCDGSGVLEGEEAVPAAPGERVTLSLEHIGIHSVVLDVHLVGSRQRRIA